MSKRSSQDPPTISASGIVVNSARTPSLRAIWRATATSKPTGVPSSSSEDHGRSSGATFTRSTPDSRMRVRRSDTGTGPSDGCRLAVGRGVRGGAGVGRGVRVGRTVGDAVTGAVVGGGPVEMT